MQKNLKYTSLSIYIMAPSISYLYQQICKVPKTKNKFKELGESKVRWMGNE